MIDVASSPARILVIHEDQGKDGATAEAASPLDLAEPADGLVDGCCTIVRGNSVHRFRCDEAWVEGSGAGSVFGVWCWEKTFLDQL